MNRTLMEREMCIRINAGLPEAFWAKAEEDMEVEQMDVKMPFFYGDFEDDIYMSQPQRSLEASKGNLVYRMRRSSYCYTMRYVFTCGGGQISRTVLQSVTALSTIKMEYMTLTEASKEALWLTRLAKEFEIAKDLVVIQSDS
ncbi:unnamed protein product [Prunus brigantina]